MERITKAKLAGSDIDASPLYGKGQDFLQTIISSLSEIGHPRYQIESHHDNKDATGQVIWDNNNPIAGFMIYRNQWNNSKLITWDCRDSPIKPPKGIEAGKILAEL